MPCAEEDGYYRFGSVEGATGGVHAVRLKSDVMTWPKRADGSWSEQKYCVQPGTYCGLVILFSKDFVRLVAVATLIAVPLVYFGAHSWLQNYAFHIGVEWYILVAPPLLLLAVALAEVGIQSIKTALRNPIDSLKTE